MNNFFNKIRTDGLMNALTGMGGAKDPTQYNEIAYRIIRLTRDESASLYEQNKILRKLCDMFPDAATAQGGQATFGGKKVPPELPDQIAAKLRLIPVGVRLQSKNGKDSRGVMAAFRQAKKLANIHGNAAIIMICDDGEDLDQPINFKKLGKVESLYVLDRWDIYPDIANTADLQQIDKYLLVRGQIGKLQTSRVHADRVLWFVGDENTVWTRMINNGCDNSVFISVFDAWQSYKVGLQGISRMIVDASQRKHGIKGLLDNLEKNGKEFETFIQDRLKVNDLSNSIWQTFVYDKDEEDISYLERAAFSGVEAAVNMLKSDFIANTDLTASQLFGDFVGGILTAGSETERDQTNLAVSLKQAELTPCMLALIDVILRSKEFGNLNPLEVQLDWQWNSYLQPSPTEQSELELNRVSLANTLNQIDPRVAQAAILSFYKGTKFNPTINLPPELIKSLENGISDASKPQPVPSGLPEMDQPDGE
jgi:hypothetical protein